MSLQLLSIRCHDFLNCTPTFKTWLVESNNLSFNLIFRSNELVKETKFVIRNPYFWLYNKCRRSSPGISWIIRASISSNIENMQLYTALIVKAQKSIRKHIFFLFFRTWFPIFGCSCSLSTSSYEGNLVC